MERKLLAFLNDDRAAMTIEFVIWIPLIVSLLTIIIDATSLYVTHTEMWNVARDTARRMVVGKFLTETAAEDFAVDALYLRDLPYYVEATYDETTAVQVVVLLSTADMSILGLASPMRIFGTTMEARVLMRPDPRVPFQTGS